MPKASLSTGANSAISNIVSVNSPNRRKKPIKAADIAVFTRQLATMMKAGVPLVQSFDIVADGIENPSMKELVTTIKTVYVFNPVTEEREAISLDRFKSEDFPAVLRGDKKHPAKLRFEKEHGNA